MDCQYSTVHLDEDLLLFALDNATLSQEKKAHLEHCSSCQQQLAFFQRADSLITVRLYRSQCPNATALNLLCANMLSSEETQTITQHLACCPLCTDEVEQIRSILDAFEPFPAPPYAPFPYTSIRRILATPVAQPAAPMPQSSLPHTATLSWSRHYQAEALYISFYFVHTASGEDLLLGHFSSDESDNRAALIDAPVDVYRMPELLHGHMCNRRRSCGEPLMSATVDTQGNVTFASLPTGKYILVAHMPELEVVLKGVTI